MTKSTLAKLAGWVFGLTLLLLRMTCRLRVHNDSRNALAIQGFRHVYGTFHSHQIGGLWAAERGTGAIVSRSADGEIVVPSLRLFGHVAIRGSSGTGSKGGATALQALIEHVKNGHVAMLAVDGPRGPRGRVQKGIGLLAKKTNAAVLMAVSVPSRRWVITKTWDRLQIPKPFSRIDLYMSEPLVPRQSESLEEFTRRIESALAQLELEYDPEEVQARMKAGSLPVQHRSAA